jgi:hypothetical protein
MKKGLFRVGLTEVGWSGVASAIEERLPELRDALEIEAILRRVGVARGLDLHQRLAHYDPGGGPAV